MHRWVQVTAEKAVVLSWIYATGARPVHWWVQVTNYVVRLVRTRDVHESCTHECVRGSCDSRIDRERSAKSRSVHRSHPSATRIAIVIRDPHRSAIRIDPRGPVAWIDPKLDLVRHLNLCLAERRQRCRVSVCMCLITFCYTDRSYS